MGIEEEEMQVVRGCVKKICYKWYKCYAVGRTIVMILMTPRTVNGYITASDRGCCAETDCRLYVGWNFSPRTLRLCWLHIIQKNSSLTFASGESLFLLDLSSFCLCKVWAMIRMSASRWRYGMPVGNLQAHGWFPRRCRCSRCDQFSWFCQRQWYRNGVRAGICP